MAFPDSFEEQPPWWEAWSTDGDGEWVITDKKAADGNFSLRSPVLEGSTMKMSNATLQICDDYLGGEFNFKVIASVGAPNDFFYVYIDSEKATYGTLLEWTDQTFELEPGPHTIVFSYEYNKFNLDPLPPNPPTREGEYDCGISLDLLFLLSTNHNVCMSLFVRLQNRSRVD